MAARENQGYLIAIILLVLLTVILAILTYFAFSQAGAAQSNLDQKDGLLKTANGQLTAYEEQAAVLKAYIGISPYTVAETTERVKQIDQSGHGPAIEETQLIVSKYDADMNRYIRPTADGVEKTYPGLVDDMSSALMAKHIKEIALNSTVEVAEEEKKELIEQQKAEIEKKDEQLVSARRDLQIERDLHIKTQNDLNKELANSKEANRIVNETFARARSDWTTREQELVQARSNAEDSKKILEERLAKYESKRFEAADGRVVRVNPDLDRVYVDMGSADNLQRRQAFAIFDQKSDTFERGKEKAKIEITNITGPHTAEARIVESTNVSPILTGDYAMTATWDRGYGVPVALAGFFDLDGDGKSDLDRLISLIGQNGGKVIAYHDENGQVNGKVTEDTRFLVVGAEPTQIEQIQAMSKIQKGAEDFVVQRIPLREFMNAMGIRAESKVLQGTGTMGRGTRFPDRQPPKSSGGSAFDN